MRTEQTAVYTNTGPAVAFRAPGHVEGAFALEQAMDELARKLEIDPVELRRRNYSEIDQLEGKPYTLPEGLPPQLRPRHRGLRLGRADRQRPRKAPSAVASASPPTIGSAGRATIPPTPRITLNADGTAEVVTGAQDIGTGSRTGLAQVAAEELGLPLDQVAFLLGDTAIGPYAPTSSGSCDAGHPRPRHPRRGGRGQAPAPPRRGDLAGGRRRATDGPRRRASIVDGDPEPVASRSAR